MESEKERMQGSEDEEEGWEALCSGYEMAIAILNTQHLWITG